jgi:hypothetical protein
MSFRPTLTLSEAEGEGEWRNLQLLFFAGNAMPNSVLSKTRSPDSRANPEIEECVILSQSAFGAPSRESEMG